MNDRRDQQLHFRVSKQELERIRKKMESSGILSIGSYLRKMALDGYCLHLDLQEIGHAAKFLQVEMQAVAIQSHLADIRT